eukprot:3400411-Rhodomonas_salina.3
MLLPAIVVIDSFDVESSGVHFTEASVGPRTLLRAPPYPPTRSPIPSYALPRLALPRGWY